MSTQCGIAIHEENGYECIYCHSDGYPEYMWPMLTENYNSEELARKLVGFGDASYIAEKFETNLPHSFDKPQWDTCCFYHRDRGDSWEEVKPAHYSHSEKNRLLSEWFYLYIFDIGTGCWNFYKGGERINK